MSRVLLRKARLRFIGSPVRYYMMDLSNDVNLTYVSPNDPAIDPFVRGGFVCEKRYAILARDHMDDRPRVCSMTEETYTELSRDKSLGSSDAEIEYEVTMRMIWADFFWIRIKDPVALSNRCVITEHAFKEILPAREKMLEELTSLHFKAIMRLLDNRRRVIVHDKLPKVERAIEVLQADTGPMPHKVFKPIAC